MRTKTVIVLLLAPVAGCGSDTSGPLLAADPVMTAARAGDWRVDIQAEREALVAADRAQAEAAAADFPAGFAISLSEDPVYLPPGADALRGTAAITAYLSAAFGDVTGFERTVARADVAAAGDVGYTFGWTITTRVGGGVAYGKYLAGWVKDASGAWRLAAYLPNASAGPAGPVPPWFRDLVDSGVRAAAPVGAPEARASMLAADAAFADQSVREGAAVAFGHYAAKQGVAVANGDGMIFGREAIRAAYDFPPGYVLRWTPVDGTASMTNDLGFSWGVYELDVPVSGGVVTLHGKYLSLWERAPSGEWRFVGDGGNSNPPPAS